MKTSNRSPSLKMKRHLAATLSLVSLAALQLACSAMVHADEIILAGGDEVFIVDAAEAGLRRLQLQVLGVAS